MQTDRNTKGIGNERLFFKNLGEAAASRITATEIKRASETAARVKGGAHTAISSTIDELMGSKEVNELACGKT